MALSTETTVVRRSEPLTAAVDDELVMLDPRQSRYFGTDEVGRRIWELLERPHTVGDLCGVLTAEFDVEPDECKTDVLDFLGDLAEADLIEAR